MSKKPVLMPKAERRAAALVIAVKLAKKVGAKRVSIAMVAAAQKVTAPLLFHIFESRDGLTKAIVKAAKAQGVVLPEAAPTVREARAAARAKLKALPKLKIPSKVAVKKLAPPKPLPKLKIPSKVAVKKLAPPKPLPKLKKLAVLLSPKVNKTGKLKPTKKGVDIVVPSVSALLRPKEAGPAPRKQLTPAQKQAKAERDRARRKPAVAAAPTTPAAKFASLPKPFQASVAAVA